MWLTPRSDLVPLAEYLYGTQRPFPSYCMEPGPEAKIQKRQPMPQFQAAVNKASLNIYASSKATILFCCLSSSVKEL